MATTELLLELFDKRLKGLAAQHGLTAEETDRIRRVFRQALANPYMDERQIYPKLTGREQSGE
jgi:hypothetical protein